VLPALQPPGGVRRRRRPLPDHGLHDRVCLRRGGRHGDPDACLQEAYVHWQPLFWTEWLEHGWPLQRTHHIVEPYPRTLPAACLLPAIPGPYVVAGTCSLGGTLGYGESCTVQCDPTESPMIVENSLSNAYTCGEDGQLSVTAQLICKAGTYHSSLLNRSTQLVRSDTVTRCFTIEEQRTLAQSY
jgi:hypothetical protein